MSNSLGTVKWFQPTLKGGPPTIKNHTVTHHNGLLYCFGGYDGHVNHMSLMVYDVEKQEWTTVLSENELIDQGDRGLRDHGRRRGNNFRHDGIEERPHPYKMVGQSPQGRNGHTATLAKRNVNNEEKVCIFIIGGWLGSGPFAASDLHVLDITNPEELVWVPVRQYQTAGPCNMHSADFIPSKNEIYVFRGGNGCEYLNELHALDVNDLSWRSVETSGEAPQQRANHSSAFLEESGQLFIFGGWNGKERLNDIHILDTNTSTWSRPYVAGPLPHPRAGMSLTALRGKLYLFGGSGTSSKCFQDLHVLDPVEMTWLEVVQQDTKKDNSADSGDGRGYNENGRKLDGPDAHKVEDWRSQELIDRQRSSTSDRDEYLYSSSSRVNAANPNEIENEPCIAIRGAGPGRRAGHTATAVNRFIYVFGGSCGSDYLNDFFVLDTDPAEYPKVTNPTSQQLVGRRLKYLCNKEEFADVVFLVEGRRIYGHKMILALASDFYGAMFSISNGFRETSSGCPEIDVPNCSYEAFLCIMEYIYSGSDPKIEVLSIQTIVDILQMADQLLLDHLKERCEQILQPVVNESTVEFLLQVAQKTNANQLASVCNHFIRNHVPSGNDESTSNHFMIE